MSPSLVANILLGSLLLLVLLALFGQALWRDPFWFLRRSTRNGFAWLIAVLLSLHYLDSTWNNTGEVTCDFAGQWLMGRMFYRQRAHELYLIVPQREVLAEGYQGDDLPKMDRDILQKGTNPEDEVEGPLYPPTDGLFMLPFAALPPKASHTVLTLLYLQIVFLTGWFISDITRGRLRMGEATLLCLIYPNFVGGLILGQNSSLTLAIVTAGWTLWVRRMPLLAGLVWGLLAYKPVFAAALIWVPVFLPSLRMLVGMVVSGGGFCLATLPFCGIDAWLRWLHVGRKAAYLYSCDINWVWMSRDLVGLPRREMWDWESLRAHIEYVLAQRDWDQEVLQSVQASWVQTLIGYGLLFGVIAITMAIVGGTALWRRRKGWSDLPLNWGPRPAFLLFGALLTVYHFMHYDLQPLALPTALFLASLDRLRWPGRVLLVTIILLLAYCHMDLTIGLSSLRIPFETFLVLLLWAWTGVLTLREGLGSPWPRYADPEPHAAMMTKVLSD